LNSGRIGGPTGKENAINGTAVRPDPQNQPGELIVAFPGSPKSSKANCKWTLYRVAHTKL